MPPLNVSVVFHFFGTLQGEKIPLQVNRLDSTESVMPFDYYLYVRALEFAKAAPLLLPRQMATAARSLIGCSF